MKRFEKRRQGRTVRLSILAGAAGLAFIVGCASTMSSSTVNSGGTAGLDNSHSQTSQRMAYIHRQAREYQLPDQYLSEARVGMAEVEQKIDTANAAEVERDATLRERTAHNSARRRDALSKEEIALAEATKLQSEYAARHTNTAAELAARERNVKAEADANMTIRTALAKQGMSAKADLISQAEHEFAQSQARLEQMRKVRAATEKDSMAEIDNMREQVRGVRSRADANVSSLRTEAGSVKEQTSARIAELTNQIQTVREQSQANSSRLLTSS